MHPISHYEQMRYELLNAFICIRVRVPMGYGNLVKKTA